MKRIKMGTLFNNLKHDQEQKRAELKHQNKSP